MPDDRRVLDGVDRLIVDGTNLVHALGRVGAPLPPVAVIGRLRAVLPPEVAVTVVLDGSPEWGLVTRHLASGVEVRHSGRATADELILRLVADSPLSIGQRGSTMVVTDDIDLAEAVRLSGGRTARNSWLIGRLERQRLAAPAPGRPSPPPSPAAGPLAGRDSDSGSGDPDAGRWSPGRGATRKRGNPRRRPSSGR
jgi:hypothetical protein